MLGLDQCPVRLRNMKAKLVHKGYMRNLHYLILCISAERTISPYSTENSIRVG